LINQNVQNAENAQGIARLARYLKRNNNMITVKRIERRTTIEDILAEFPSMVDYLLKRGIRCIECGEPVWGTLEEALKEKGFGEDGINFILEEMNQITALK
jgi:hypothetical protein